MNESPNRISNGSSATSWATRNARSLLLIALAALGVHDIFSAHGFIAMRRTAREIDAARDEITKLDDENRALADQVGALKSDPRMIERIAREEMGLARPGEMIFKVPADPATSASADGNSAAGGNAGTNNAGDKPQQ
ncbi:MAG: septum formation initiator family protein [Candidatus Acidiferrales bacterium]